MIEVDSTPEDDVVIVRFRGIVTAREFTDLAATIAHLISKNRILIYLDWLEIEYWQFAVPRPNGVEAWRRARQTLKRAAIIHRPRLNRQAAWLAAVLREGGVEVRSWLPKNASTAAIWLRRPSTGATLH
jgi:hypothetical protein